MNQTKILFIGFDSAEPELLNKWCNDGTLPNLKALRDRSAWGDVSYPAFLGSGAMWLSLLTGVRPATHGRYYFSQIKPNGYEHYRYKREFISSEPAWNALSKAGKSVAIIDAPQVPLDPNINGLHIVDWLVHDKHYETPQFVPASLRGEIETTYGMDSVNQCDRFEQSTAGLTDLYNKIVERIHRKTEFALKKLSAKSWDLFGVVFHDSHCIGHQCWHVRDTEHPLHDAKLAETIGDPIRNVYIELDNSIGQLLNSVGSETQVVFFDGPGMGPNYTGNHILEEVLSRLDPSSDSVGRPLSNMAKKFWRRLPRKIKFLAPLRERALKVGNAMDSRNWTKCSFFQVPHNDISGAIRINLKGREPNGRISPGTDLQMLIDELKRDLLEIKNLDTGEPAVVNVFETAEWMDPDEPHFNEMPDLFVEWNRQAPIGRVGSEKIGVVQSSFNPKRTGDHTPASVVFSSGPGITPGRLDEAVDLLAIFNSIAAQLNVAFDQAQAPPDPRIYSAY